MAYEYIRKYYGVNPQVGQRVRVPDGKIGIIQPVEGDPQYLDVRFNGQQHTVPVHPTDVEYL